VIITKHSFFSKHNELYLEEEVTTFIKFLKLFNEIAKLTIVQIDLIVKLFRIKN
tara:strand:- start:45 stop:206 length:162 start_codon:yes stop_codon:yes gene_type:complete